MTTAGIATPVTPVPAAPTCGGCFKPVDPETSVKRPIYPSAPRYGRSRALPAPVVCHYCDTACRQRADDAAHGRGGFRF